MHEYIIYKTNFKSDKTLFAHVCFAGKGDNKIAPATNPGTVLARPANPGTGPEKPTNPTI